MNKTAVIIFILATALSIGAILVYANSRGGLRLPGNNKVSQELSTFSAPPGNTTPTMNVPQITELEIEDIVIGTGSAVKSGDKAEVNYTGTLLDGTKFDSSFDRNETFEFQVGAGEVIKGWDQGLVGMKVGGKRKLVIPANLAYGDRATGPIPPNSPLIFEIELVSIKE